MSGRWALRLLRDGPEQIRERIGTVAAIAMLDQLDGCFESTEGTAVLPEDQISDLIREQFPLTPRGIIKHLNLLRPIYKQTARHGHFGRKPGADGGFSWEKTDKADALAKAAGIKAKKAG